MADDPILLAKASPNREVSPAFATRLRAELFGITCVIGGAKYPSDWGQISDDRWQKYLTAISQVEVAGAQVILVRGEESRAWVSGISVVNPTTEFSITALVPTPSIKEMKALAENLYAKIAAVDRPEFEPQRKVTIMRQNTAWGLRQTTAIERQVLENAGEKLGFLTKNGFAPKAAFLTSATIGVTLASNDELFVGYQIYVGN